MAVYFYSVQRKSLYFPQIFETTEMISSHSVFIAVGRLQEALQQNWSYLEPKLEV